MYLFGPFRQMLSSAFCDPSIGKLTDTTRALICPVIHGSDRSSRSAVTLAQTIFEIRNLIYAGFYEEARGLAERYSQQSTDPTLCWMQYLNLLSRFLINPNDSAVDELARIANHASHVDSLLGFYVDQLRSMAHSFHRKSSCGILKRLEKYLELFELQGMPKTDLQIFRGRVLQEKIRWANGLEDSRELYREFDDLLECLDTQVQFDTNDRLNSNKHRDLLLKETCLRLLRARAIHEWAKERFSQAAEYVRRAAEIDPFCPQLAVIGGQLSERLNNIHEAEWQYGRAAEFGIIERTFALGRLARMRKDTSARTLLNRDADASNVTGYPLPHHRVRNIKNGPRPKPPIELQYVLTAWSKSPQKVIQGTKGYVRRSETYRRFPMYWTLRFDHTSTSLPTFAYAPIYCFQAARDVLSPEPEALFPQHCFHEGFREQLLFASMPGFKYFPSNEIWGSKIDDLVGSSRFIQLREWIRWYDEMGSLRQAYILRLLSYLGFFEEAAGLMRGRRVQANAAMDMYLQYTMLFVRHLCEPDTDFDVLCEVLWKQRRTEGSNIRTLLSICILGGVHAARRKRDFVRIAVWRRRGGKVLQNLERSVEHYSRFERDLMSSRFWRFASFEPFFAGEASRLLKESEESLFLARSLSPATPKQLILKKDNMYAAMETYARSLLHVGDTWGARFVIEKAVVEADPKDARLWTQLGEYRERCGDLESAVAAYDTAALLGPPYRMIALFKSASVLERTGQWNEASTRYMRSVRYYPYAVESLVSLVRVGKQSGRHHLASWAQDALECVRRGGESPNGADAEN